MTTKLNHVATAVRRIQGPRAPTARGVPGSKGFRGRSIWKQWQHKKRQSKLCLERRQGPRFQEYSLPPLDRRPPGPKPRP